MRRGGEMGMMEEWRSGEAVVEGRTRKKMQRARQRRNVS